MNCCKAKEGAYLITGTDDSLLFGALEKLKNTNWSTIPTKQQCIEAITKKLYNLKNTVTPSCDITIDNPKVKDSVISSMETLWNKAIAMIEKNYIEDPAKALESLKKIFVNAFIQMKAK